MVKPKLFAIACFAWLATGCGGTSTGNPESSTAVEDTSASGAVAGAVGGALSNSESSGTLAFIQRTPETRFSRAWKYMGDAFLPDALAANSCPTFRTAQGDGCSASGLAMWLTYGSCEFSGSKATWLGTQSLTVSSGSTDPSCGTFPSPAASGDLILQYVSGSGSTTPSSAYVTSAYGTVGTVDDHTSNLGNFDSATIATISNSGYGSQVDFNSSGLRSSLTVAHRISSPLLFDESVTGTVTISESAGATQRTISGGSITVYHNLLQVIGTSSFTNVIHKDGCCFPVSGSIQTTFSASTTGHDPTSLGEYAVGRTETLTFTGCGTGTLQSYDGTTQSVVLTRCF
jgi:hypothetical protein